MNKKIRRTIMKKTVVALTVVSLLVLGIFAEASAKMGYNWKGSGGWGTGTPYQSLFDPSKLETVKGVIESVEMINPMKSVHNAVALILKTDKESLTVHLGPDWYISRLDTKLNKGDTIEVKGAKAIYSGKTFIIASEIKKGDATLVLRNDNGIPVWAGWRKQ
jgi:hypothetical protein